MSHKKVLLVLILLFFAFSSYGASDKSKPSETEKETKTKVDLQTDGLAEKYLDKKVTLSEDSTTVAELLEKLSKATGANFVAGVDDDWRVRERKIRIYAYESYLSHVMYSIVDVTKFYWIVKDENTYILSYRDDTDSLIDSLATMVEEARMADKIDALNDLLTRENGEDLAEMREKEPIKYLMRSTGLDASFSKSLKSTPGLFDSIVSGRKRTFTGNEIANETLIGIKETNDTVKNLAKDSLNSRGMGRYTRIVDQVVPAVADTPSNTEITVNEELPSGLQRRIPANLMGSIVDGYAVVRENGKIVSAIPIINSRSAVANKVAKVLVDLMENPNMTLEDAQIAIMNPETLRDLAKDINRYDDVYRMPIPYDPAFNTVIDLKIVPQTLPETLDLFSVATSTSVFCDDFPSESRSADFVDNLKKRVSIRQIGTVYDILGDICRSFDLNVTYTNNHFNFYSIRWFDKIKNLVSIEYMNKWAEEYKTTGTLSLDTLRGMGNYSSTQISTAFTQKEELRPLIGTVLANQNALEMLAKSDEYSFSKMLSESGIVSSHLNRTAYESYVNLYQLSKTVNRTNTNIKLRVESNEKSEVYVLYFTALDNGEIKNIKFEVPKYGEKKETTNPLLRILE